VQQPATNAAANALSDPVPSLVRAGGSGPAASTVLLSLSHFCCGSSWLLIVQLLELCLFLFAVVVLVISAHGTCDGFPADRTYYCRCFHASVAMFAAVVRSIVMQIIFIPVLMP
jgi:hypothetical protein